MGGGPEFLGLLVGWARYDEKVNFLSSYIEVTSKHQENSGKWMNKKRKWNFLKGYLSPGAIGLPRH